jgi:hypothetical protein
MLLAGANLRCAYPLTVEFRRSCVADHLLRVRISKSALYLTDCASDAGYRLSQCASADQAPVPERALLQSR